MAPTQVDFFVSDTQSDAQRAEWIAWELEAAEYSARLMAWDFRPGQSFVRMMQEALTASRQIVLVLSPAYLATGEIGESRSLLERSVAIAIQSLGAQHPNTHQYQQNLAHVMVDEK